LCIYEKETPRIGVIERQYVEQALPILQYVDHESVDRPSHQTAGEQPANGDPNERKLVTSRHFSVPARQKLDPSFAQRIGCPAQQS